MILEWSLTIDIYGYVINEEGGNIVGSKDKFMELVGNGLSSVSITTGTSTDFGGIRTSATVRTTCNQDEKTIDKAGEACFDKSLELTMLSFSTIRRMRKEKPELFEQ